MMTAALSLLYISIEYLGMTHEVFLCCSNVIKVSACNTKFSNKELLLLQLSQVLVIYLKILKESKAKKKTYKEVICLKSKQCITFENASFSYPGIKNTLKNKLFYSNK